MKNRARLGRNSQRFGNLTDVEREVVRASVLFSMGSKFIDPAYYTDEAVEEIVEYLDWEPMRMRAIDRIEHAKAAGLPIQSLPDWEFYARQKHAQPWVDSAEIESEQEPSRAHLPVEELTHRKINTDNPWAWLHRFLAQKTCDQCELAVEDLREDAAELLEEGRSPKSAERWFLWKATLVYREILWTAFKGAFVFGAFLGRMLTRFF